MFMLSMLKAAFSQRNTERIKPLKVGFQIDQFNTFINENVVQLISCILKGFSNVSGVLPC